MNTANKLTLTRVFLIPLFLVVLYLDFPYNQLIALAIFVLASVTDFIDGYIARHYDQVTDFGKFMDPLADKLLVMAALIWFVSAGRFPAWAMLVVVAREFAVTALRLIAVEGGRVIAAAWSGKIKTASTMVGICVMFLFSNGVADVVVMAVIVLTTLYSGVEYFVKNKDVINWKDI
ncbi:CDP-diacylglycerol--glycerol-3-phosphate 3-phosphatidyltransferase [Pseudoflavonifractor sp. BIOML-A6]|jgi:CDP-diacylglycerol--glycerol-3-phosphate 3-phosphatidyltransferase|nr:MULTISPECIES: CDP-diacylglycerol--glycerol-3-phosphate 3-phosphatidyltransferase [unclassified Pseudoflavonifractor]MTQ96811.1 CDP-diacylglycerol--glycerol-3-phosphate 3-phosphatidyltransferase [Pseudoflavonifractor sp. BIOML-A16]MTR05096.1 CDP-diacylglycerol--glycerol-3-phosphate 3-phosphatidyltransferase [Pseudoflavonifractor sp. BIOML-A15]MTR32717.1 CDP-diacylglycerol--glycerol-3-phosphate 3-phosphatidyltransferase [Pseudoflavonifractor sp. BIOML-A14]MTR72111.1 CDP-diacylglycerol--glycero